MRNITTIMFGAGFGTVRLLLFPGIFALGFGQTPAPPQSQPAAEKNAPEVSSHEAPATFGTRVNLVPVRVVVRDKSGKAIGNLQKEDFLLFDKGKIQFISRFSVEKAGASPALVQTEDGAEPKDPNTPPPPPMADRFLVYLFDDVHASFAEISYARKAAQNQLADTIKGSGRAAIFTTSGQDQADFTGDLAKLQETLDRIQPRGRLQTSSDCPQLTYYQADLIQKQDQAALNAAVQDTIVCADLSPQMASSAQAIAQATASRVYVEGEAETRLALSVLQRVVRRVAAMPGQRTIVLVSPGFLIPNDDRYDESQILDRAARTNVTISTLDARGLYVVVDGDASQPTRNLATLGIRQQYVRDAALAQDAVLEEFADATGGIFVHNTNDLDAGFRRIAVPPEYVYVLGFSPQNLKYDGNYHTLKVTLKNPAGLTVLARHGYTAPKRETDPAAEAKQAIEEALFSRDEMREIPVELHTQFFKSSGVTAQLAVLAKVDVRQLHFRKDAGRNKDTLTVVAGLFDRNGNFINAMQKTVEMKLRDETLETRLGSGITVRSNFDITPGNYVVRLVLRDSEGQMMAALTGAVVIP